MSQLVSRKMKTVCVNTHISAISIASGIRFGMKMPLYCAQIIIASFLVLLQRRLQLAEDVALLLGH